MKKLSILLLVAGMMSCSSVQTVYDYSKEADFSKYKSYEFADDELSAEIGELDRNRLIPAVESEMAAKGFSKSDNPDMLVHLHMKSKQKVQATATTTGGYGRYGWYGGYSSTNVNYDEYTEGTLFITFIDAGSQNIVWQGTGTKTLSENASPDKRDAKITYSVQQILSNYPPPK